jgi:hypothetical protein
MDEDPNVIRQNIDQTRSALTEKLETLEAEVKGTVQGAKASVDNTIETVKDTIQSVKRTFDLAYQTEQHPWPMMGGSVVAGFVCGHLFEALTATGRHAAHDHRPQERHEPPLSASSFASQAAAAAERPNGPTGGAYAAPAPSATSNLLHWVSSQFGPEIEQLKGMAIGAAVGVLRDLAKRNVPPHLAQQVEELMNKVTSKLGGQPVQGEVLSSTGPRPRQTQTDAHW